VVTSYLWDIEAQLLTCLLRHAGTTDVLICCSLSAEAHASHPLANDLLQAQGQDDDAGINDDDDSGGHEHGSTGSRRSSAFAGRRLDRLDFASFGRRLAQHSARLSGLDPAHLIAGLPGHPRVIVLYLPLHAVFALQQPTTPATAAATAAAPAVGSTTGSVGASAGSASPHGVANTRASASAAAGTLGWFTLTKSPATRAFPLQRWHVPEAARAQAANDNTGAMDPVQTLRAVDVPPNRASTLKALADALAG